MAGRPTINLESLKTTIHLYYCEQNHSLNDVVNMLNAIHGVQVNSRTLKRRLAEWQFTKYHDRISCDILPILQARIIQLFHHHILSDKEILRVLHNEGYQQLTMRRVQLLRLALGLSRHPRSGNFITDQDQLRDLLEHELGTGTIQHYGRRRVYEHLRRQGYLVAR